MTVKAFVYKGQPMMRAFGIPYARQEVVLGEVVSICPRCNRAISLRQRKDFESFTGIEYADHYHEEHAKADGRVFHEGEWWEPAK